MKTHAAFQVAGRFQLTVRKADGSIKQQTDWFDNLLLNQGLNRIGEGGHLYDRAMVGSGTSTAAVGQTALDNQIASTTNAHASANSVDIEAGYAAFTRTYRFAQGAAAGNLGEVGVGYGVSALFSRARIVDGEGDPTTITVLGDEFLDVTYQFRVYWPTTDAVAEIDISGVPYDTVTRPALVGAWGSTLANLLGNTNGLAQSTANDYGSAAYGAGALGDITVSPGGTYLGGNAFAYLSGAYVNNSHQRNFSLAFGINFTAPISNVQVVMPMGIYKVSFDPPIPKDNTNQLVLYFTLSWARKTI